MHTTLRRTKDAMASTEEAVAIVRQLHGAEVLYSSGNSVLADLAEADLQKLRDQFSGWIISPQGPPIPVPDTRIKLRRAP